MSSTKSSIKPNARPSKSPLKGDFKRPPFKGGAGWVLFCLASMALAACSTAQKISIRQEQQGQIQETIIEQQGRIENMSLSLYLL